MFSLVIYQLDPRLSTYVSVILLWVLNHLENKSQPSGEIPDIYAFQAHSPPRSSFTAIPLASCVLGNDNPQRRCTSRFVQATLARCSIPLAKKGMPRACAPDMSIGLTPPRFISCSHSFHILCGKTVNPQTRARVFCMPSQHARTFS